jgi:hypothetical protein
LRRAKIEEGEDVRRAKMSCEEGNDVRRAKM